MGSDYPAYLLPLLTMVSVSLLFVIQSTSIHYEYLRGRPFVSFARSLGFSEQKIKFLHILSGILHYLRSDIPKLTAILFGSLFITERIFSNPGITRLIFGYAFETGRAVVYSQMKGEVIYPHMNIALAALLSLILMYYFITLSLNILIRCAEFLIIRLRTAS
jgi:peptide/nickel transport system permease protein